MRECRELEECFDTYFTEAITNKNVYSLMELKKAIMGVDNIKMLEKCVEKAPMIAKVAESLGWAKLWDHALDLGWKAVLGLKMVGRAMSHHRRGGHLCHMCDVTSLKDDSVLDHILNAVSYTHLTLPTKRIV